MIKVKDVAWARFSAPDLDQMEKFLTDFGLVRAHRTDDALYMRGTDSDPWIHATHLGEPGFRGVAFEAASAADLAAAADLEGASERQAIDEPGGGERVRFTDPDGFPIEIVHGRKLADPLAVRSALPLNRGTDRQRKGVLQRIAPGPSQVKRLGHVVLRVSDFDRSSEWYKSRFGFLSSDDVSIGDPGKVVTSFMRCDRGEEFVDHHTFLCVGLGGPAFDHAAFEVEDFDAVMVGHDHLAAAKYDHAMGIGRHVLGSQVYDYWRDPWGHMVEHFTDGDLLNASTPTGRFDPATALGTQWGQFGPGGN
jgi:catechol 2,3-dioxygenase-like lactoylglutathione lyase family enzyme